MENLNRNSRILIVLSLRDSCLETMSLLFVFCNTEPPLSLDRVLSPMCPCLCLSTAAIRFFTLSPSAEAVCAVTLASSKSVQPSPRVERELGVTDGKADDGELLLSSDCD